ncbi:MAG: UTRA domain-containing protein, partial [Bacillota bacterium]
DPTTEIIKVNRLRKIDDRPIALQCSYISESVLSLEQARKVYETRSLYKILRENEVYPRRAHEKYNADVLQDARQCQLLQMEDGEPVFKVMRFTYTDDDLLFEYAVSILKGDIYTMEVELEE